jgi:SsrA-binding protein
VAKKKKKDEAPGEMVVARNPKAQRRFEIEERVEAGLVLTGSEVKSLRARAAVLDGAYARLENDEVWLHKMKIAAYEHSGYVRHDPERKRKVLLRRNQIERLRGKLTMQGYTLVPLQCYFKNGFAKLELGLGKGRSIGDQRQALRRKQDLREAEAAMGRKLKR